MEIKGLSVFITGGASGMGWATAERFAAEGAKVAIFDLNDEVAQIRAREVNGLGFGGDVTDEKAVGAALKDAAQKHGGLHVVVNCAGVATAGRIFGKEGPLSLEAFRRVIDINLVGTFNVMRLAVPLMSDGQSLNMDNERGVIINTASIAAFEGQVGQAAYAASKGGIVGLTLPAAREFARFGVRVMTIAPGLIETPLFANLSPQAVEALNKQTLYPARLGQPQEFAQLAATIIQNPLLNGSVIRLDGGVRLP